jgi:hypothetical protein
MISAGGGRAVGMFDQNGRQAAKIDGAGFVAWLLRRARPEPPVRFESWDDTRRTSWPGGPDRTDDLVAVLARTDRTDARARLIIEVALEPERATLPRLGVYQLLLAQEVGEDVAVGGALLHLTGTAATTDLRLALPGGSGGLALTPLVVDLCGEDAATTLGEIEQGTTARCMLPWLPLMAGGGEPALIDRWKRLAKKVRSAERRAAYREMALVFAELSKELVNWQNALEGWEMKESQFILRYIRRGQQEGEVRRGRADLLDCIQLRLQDPVPEEVRLAVEGTNDPDTLRRWNRVALTATSLDELRAAMRAAP